MTMKADYLNSDPSILYYLDLFFMISRPRAWQTNRVGTDVMKLKYRKWFTLSIDLSIHFYLLQLLGISTIFQL